MSALPSSSPTPHRTDDTSHFHEALSIFLNQSGYAQNCPFTDLTRLEQSVVLRMAQKLKEGR